MRKFKKQMIIRKTDVLIIGGGAAGIRAAVAAKKFNAEALLIANNQIAADGSTYSNISQGWGIQALIGGERNEADIEKFCREILKAGARQCDPELVRILVEESGPRVEDLISYGMRFKKTSEGDFLRASGCFSKEKRAFLTENLENIKQTFSAILNKFAVETLTGTVIELITSDGECSGAWIISKKGTIILIRAKAVVLASGGGAGIFKNHLVTNTAAGDGYALALKAGALLINMEFIQFMLGLKKNKTNLFLPLGELSKPAAMRDPNGSDILKNYIPDKGLRNKAIQLRQKHMPFSSADASMLIDIAVAKTYENNKAVSWHGKNSTATKFKVNHFAHAFNGGIKINKEAESTIPGLFAAGEVAAGPHGADRIGGCMMTATQVFAKRAGEYAAKRANNLKSHLPIKTEKINRFKRAELLPDKNKSSSLPKIEDHIKITMQKYVMILRSEKGLKAAHDDLNKNEKMLEQLNFKEGLNIRHYTKTKNMLITGKLIIKSALKRKDSLGAHYREDMNLFK